MSDAFEPPEVSSCAGCQRSDVQLLSCDDCVEPAGTSREETAKER